jgi:hypothetical protein
MSLKALNGTYFLRRKGRTTASGIEIPGDGNYGEVVHAPEGSDLPIAVGQTVAYRVLEGDYMVDGEKLWAVQGKNIIAVM